MQQFEKDRLNQQTQRRYLWLRFCNGCKSLRRSLLRPLLLLLDELLGELEHRKALFREAGCANLADYNRQTGSNLPRYILATQRPDANILPGQIRNNIDCRICGRADTILSQIILDSTAAAEQIPKDAAGRFLLHDGTVFQAFWWSDAALR